MRLHNAIRKATATGCVVAWGFAVPALLLCGPAIAAPPLPAGPGTAIEASSPTPAAAQRRRRRSSRRKGQNKPTAERIREIQAALIREGYLSGEPNGVWDDATTNATRRFQEDNGFPVTGKPEALTLIKLKLGPPTAGVGAPRGRTEVEGAKGAGGGGGRN